MGQGAMSMTQPAAPVYDATPTPVSAMQLAAQKTNGGLNLSDNKMAMIASLLKQAIPQRPMIQQTQQPDQQQAYQQSLNQFNSGRGY